MTIEREEEQSVRRVVFYHGESSKIAKWRRRESIDDANLQMFLHRCTKVYGILPIFHRRIGHFAAAVAAVTTTTIAIRNASFAGYSSIQTHCSFVSSFGSFILCLCFMNRSGEVLINIRESIECRPCFYETYNTSLKISKVSECKTI